MDSTECFEAVVRLGASERPNRRLRRWLVALQASAVAMLIAARVRAEEPIITPERTAAAVAEIKKTTESKVTVETLPLAANTESTTGVVFKENWTILASPLRELDQLSTEELRGILDGKYKDWGQLQKGSGAIAVVALNGPGNREAVATLAAQIGASNSNRVQFVNGPEALESVARKKPGVIALGLEPGNAPHLLPVAFDNVLPSEPNYSLAVKRQVNVSSAKLDETLTAIPEAPSTILPLPPPKWSDQFEFAPSLLLRPGGGPCSYGDIYWPLIRRLSDAHHPYTLYYTSGGFAVATSVDAIDSEGKTDTTRQEAARAAKLWEFPSAQHYVRVLLGLEKGGYRAFLFVVSNAPLVRRPGEPPKLDEISRMVNAGVATLPDSVLDKPVAEDTRFTALVYEFWREGSENDAPVTLGRRIGAKQHLLASGLWNAASL